MMKFWLEALLQLYPFVYENDDKLIWSKNFNSGEFIAKRGYDA